MHIHCRGWGHSHTLQRVGSFSYITEGGVIHIHCRGWGHSHTLQRVGSFTYIVEGVVIHIHCRGRDCCEDNYLVASVRVILILS